MENQLNQTSNYYRRKLGAILVFAIFFIMLGRQLTFLPIINLSSNSKEEDLKNEIENITKNKGGFYSVYYKDLKSNKSFGISENQTVTGASVNKLPIVAAAYLLNKQGKINLDEKITIQKSEIQDYGTGSLRYQTFPLTISLRNLAKLALKESDNTAAHVISVRIGEDEVQKLVSSWGMKSTKMADNKTTAYDMEIIFEKIYKGEIANSANTNELMGFMTDTDFEDRIPKNLPSNVKVYHKTGDGEGFVHDVGIVQTEKQTYYLGVMTSDIGDNLDSTKNTIAEISKKIFNKLNN